MSEIQVKQNEIWNKSIYSCQYITYSSYPSSRKGPVKNYWEYGPEWILKKASKISWPTNTSLKNFMTYKHAPKKFHDLQTWPWKISWPTNMPLKNFMTYKHVPEKFHDLHAFSYIVFSERNIDFHRKFWIETHIKSHILVIMDQKSRLNDKPFLSNEDPLKKRR